MKNAVILFFCMVLFTSLVQAQPGTIHSYQKISDTQGNFTGILDDDDEFGVTAVIGDLNGDGITDIAVGSRYDDDGGTNRGAVYIMFMNSDGTVNHYQKISSVQGNFNDSLIDGTYFGWSVTGIGDLNGDGHPDIAVSTYTVPMVWILFLNADGTVQSYQKIGEGLGGFPSGILSSGGQFGISVRSLGDFNNDGMHEIAVGASQDDDGGPSRGAFYILCLNNTGFAESYHKISQTYGNFTASLSDDCRFGRTIAPIGDLNGDGVTDLAVSSIYDNDGGIQRGAIYILFMTQDYTVKSWQKISNTQGNFTGVLDDNDQFGIGLSGISDINGDGIQDIAAGANADDDGGQNRGAVWILFMNTNGTVKAYQKISSTTGNFNAVLDDGDGFGGFVNLLGDYNNDGYPEIIVGSPHDDDGGLDHGAIYILSLNYLVNGISGIEYENSISVSHGSAGNNFILKMPAETKDIKIYNATGQLVHELKTSMKTTLDITISISGIYYINVISDRFSITKKLVVTGK
ncbi:MAG: FG-GAP-like repeat-containing protein [Bacteroidia bacterium]|nr:FG-GAP-like repeat-containing protein [Bacteroidia bacterium]